MRDSQAYLIQLQALLPPGRAWPRDPDATLTGLLAIFADALARADARATGLVEESDPRAALELLDEWERAFGLPDECSPEASTIQERRDALMTRVAGLGGQTAQYFIDLAAAFGYAVTITEYRPFLAGLSRCGDSLGGAPSNRFWWKVTVPNAKVVLFRCGAAACGDPLGKILRATELECLFNRLKPAQSDVTVSYQGA